ncbi:hypothetical protein ACHWQZ_G015083 [Mnemiopsis leidyi]
MEEAKKEQVRVEQVRKEKKRYKLTFAANRKMRIHKDYKNLRTSFSGPIGTQSVGEFHLLKPRKFTRLSSLSMILNQSLTVPDRRPKHESTTIKMFFLLVLLLNLHLAWNDDTTPTALKFGKDNRSFIYMGTVHLTGMEESFSICSWVRRSDHKSYRQEWLSYRSIVYGKGEIGICASGRASMFGQRSWYTLPTQTIGQWNHICTTFSYLSRTMQVFYNGDLIGQQSTPYRQRMNTTGTLMFGNHHYSNGDAHVSSFFGGDLYGTVFLSTVLSLDEIKELYREGRCPTHSQKIADHTVLGWEEILRHERTGFVTEFQLEACDDINPTEEATEDSTENVNFWNFLRYEEFYDHMISEEILAKVEEWFDVLGEFNNHTIDDALILHLERNHTGAGSNAESEEESEDNGSLAEVKYWKFLTGESYYQKKVSQSLISGIKSLLKVLADFLGHRIDDTLIGHLIKHHS